MTMFSPKIKQNMGYPSRILVRKPPTKPHSPEYVAQLPDLYKEMVGLSAISNELLKLQDDVVTTTNEAIEKTNEGLAEMEQVKVDIVEKVDSKLEEVDSTLETLKNTDFTGEKGEDADEERITQTILETIQDKVDETLSKIPVIDKKEIIKEVLKKIPENKASLKIIQESIDIEAVISKIKDNLAIEEIKDWKDKWEEIKREISRNKGGFHGGGFNNIASASGTVSTGLDTLKFTGSAINSVTQVGRTVVVDITGGSASLTSYAETPTGTIDGANKVFTTVHTMNFVNGLYMNGQFIHPADYSYIGTTITFVTAPDISYSGLPFTVVYY